MAVNAQGQFIETDNLKRSSAGFPEMNGLADYVASLETGGGAGGGGYRPGLGAQGIVDVPQEQYPAAEPNLIPTNPAPNPIEEVDSLDDISDEYSGKEKPGIVDNLKKIWKAFTPNDEKVKAKYEKKKSEIEGFKKEWDALTDKYYEETRGVGGQAGLNEYRRNNWSKSGYNSSTLSPTDVRTSQNSVTKHTGSDRNKSTYDDILKFAGSDGAGFQLALDKNDSLHNQFLVDNDYEPLEKFKPKESAPVDDSRVTGDRNPYYSLKTINNPKADKRGIYQGLNAPAQYKKDHPNTKLTKGQEILAAMEGYSGKKGYDDGTGVMTYGIGQTKDNKDMTFPEAYKIKEDVVRKNIPGYNQMPDYMQTALVAAQYRGDLIGDGTNGSPGTVAHLKNHNYEAAAKEFLNNENYRDAVKNKSGVKTRFDWIVAQFKKYADSLKE